MNNKYSVLLATAVISGLLATQNAKAEDSSSSNSGDQVTTEKNKCAGSKAEGKHTCKTTKKKNKEGKNSCKNGCGEAMEKSQNK